MQRLIREIGEEEERKGKKSESKLRENSDRRENVVLG